MLHAKDIMVGDWVILYGSLTRWGYTDYAKWHNEMERTDIHAVEPVRITPEILKKNGFKEEQFFGELLYGNWQILCDCSHLAMRHEVGWVVDIPCEYVHELQHLLRICGIEKEIEL